MGAWIIGPAYGLNLKQMANSFIFADEAGCFTFKRKQGASKYFILCTVSAENWNIDGALLNLRRKICLESEPDRDKLHATSDLQEVRNLVFELLAKQDFRIDATILEKSKAQDQLRESHATFYRYAWYYHFKKVGADHARQYDKMLITAAALGEKKTRAAFKESVNLAVQQILPRDRWEVAFHDSAKDPLLWAADYCAWAIQKKWERNDVRSYDLIKQKIRSEFDLFRSSQTHFY